LLALCLLAASGSAFPSSNTPRYVEQNRWLGCEQFPGFGSAADDVRLQHMDGAGSFNISTADFLSSRTCNGEPDLIWGSTGTFTCNRTGYPTATFTRESVWIAPNTFGGVLFGKVLCPHATFHRGVRTEIPMDKLPQLCGSITFDNCQVYYDALGGNGTVLHRSKAPSCDSNAAVSDDGPPLVCTSSTCTPPCDM